MKLTSQPIPSRAKWEASFPYGVTVTDDYGQPRLHMASWFRTKDERQAYVDEQLRPNEYFFMEKHTR